MRARDKAGNASAQGPSLLASTTAAGSGSSKRVVGYFTQWGIYNQQYFVRTPEKRTKYCSMKVLASPTEMPSWLDRANGPCP